MNQIDIAIFLRINEWVASAPPFLQQAIALRAWLLPWLVFIGLAVFALLPFIFQKYRSHAERIFCIVACSLLAAGIARFAIVEIIRLLVERQRPFEVLDGVTRLIPYVSDGSFPSGHAALFFALATPIAFYYRKIALAFFLAAFIISLDRILGGVHWPSDVLAGAAAGIGTAWFIFRFAKKKRFVE